MLAGLSPPFSISESAYLRERKKEKGERDRERAREGESSSSGLHISFPPELIRVGTAGGFFLEPSQPAQSAQLADLVASWMCSVVE